MSSVTIAKFYTSDYDTNDRIEIVVEWRKHAASSGAQGFVVTKVTKKVEQLGPPYITESKAIAAALRHFRKLRKEYERRIAQDFPVKYHERNHKHRV